MQRALSLLVLGASLALFAPGCNRKKADSTAQSASPRSDPSRSVADRGASTSRRVLSLPGNLGDVALDKVGARWIAFGDGGTGTPGQLAVAAGMAAHCRKAGCDFAIHTGDIVYPAGITGVGDPHLVAMFEAPYAELGVPIFLALGNHDHYGSPQAMIDAYGDGPKRRKDSAVEAHLPAPYYTFQRGGVRFLALDTEVIDDKQARWAWQVLRKARRDKEPWVVVFGHHPRRSYGAHGMAAAPLAAWLDRVLCFNVDVYVAGHDHDQQLLEPRCGVHQVISGAAGQLRPKGVGPDTVFADEELGFARFSAIKDQLRISFHGQDGDERFARTITRARPVPVCAADAVCNGLCAVDPDCKTGRCKLDKRCDPACTDDPDCLLGARDASGCGCDRQPLVCEVRSSRSADLCACDPACQAGFAPCAADGYCDTGCTAVVDPDC